MEFIRLPNKETEFINKIYNDPHILINFYKSKDNEAKNVDLYITNILKNNMKQKIVENNYLYITDREFINKLFIIFLIYYYFQIKHLKKEKRKKQFHLAIDFEFAKAEVALMQIYFLIKDQGYIWILDPKFYYKEDGKIDLINKLFLLNKNIYKILHGSDSLDLPYMYAILFQNDKEKILRFTNKLIDTRFLCEYFRISKKEEGKCSIYDALKYFGTISLEKYNELNKMTEYMGPIQDISWDIKKMSSYHIQYTFYDVLYLISLVKDIYKKIIDETPDYVRSYYYISQLLRFIILERKNITNVVDITKEVINPMNNYLIKTKGENITLITIYNTIINNFKINDNGKTIYLDFILSINYVKNIFNFILKLIIYKLVTKNFKVYKNKNESYDESIDSNKILLEINRFPKIKKLLKLFKTNADKKIKILYK